MLICGHGLLALVIDFDYHMNSERHRVVVIKAQRCVSCSHVAVQARIAAANTALTALGMWAMAIPGIGLLSLFVFICSFIPIAGVFFSTVPIAFMALTEYGFIKVCNTPLTEQTPSGISTLQRYFKFRLEVGEAEAQHSNALSNATFKPFGGDWASLCNSMVICFCTLKAM